MNAATEVAVTGCCDDVSCGHARFCVNNAETVMPLGPAVRFAALGFHNCTDDDAILANIPVSYTHLTLPTIYSV